MNGKTANFEVKRPESKTGRNFTTEIEAKPLPSCISVSLDGLSFMVENCLPEPAPDQGRVYVNDRVEVDYLKKGTPLFLHTYQVYLDGEPAAYLHTHSRNNKVIKENTAKLEIQNHVLYSTQVMNVVNAVMTGTCSTSIKNVSTLHIAIDGANHIHGFLNRYWRQSKRRLMPNLRTLGDAGSGSRIKMKGKANIDFKRFNKKTGDVNNIRVGSSRKAVVIYNKTSELERSHKQYIRDAWERAGVDTSGTVWRTELRMSSQAVKEIKDLDLSKLNDPYYLLSIFQTSCKNFFEFVRIENDENVSRAKVIDLFQFTILRVPLLQKIPRAIVKGAYKAQMAIHNAVMNIYRGYIEGKESINAALLHISDNIHLYNLARWYELKKPQWEAEYLPNLNKIPC